MDIVAVLDDLVKNWFLDVLQGDGIISACVVDDALDQNRLADNFLVDFDLFAVAGGELDFNLISHIARVLIINYNN